MLTVDDVIVEVRDRDLARIGQIDPQFFSDGLFAPRANATGAWKLELPAVVAGEEYELCAALREPGAGIIVTTYDATGQPTVFMSGLVDSATCNQSTDDPDGTWEFQGFPDVVHVEDALAFPSPGEPDATAQTALADNRTGNAEDLIYEYVDANIGPSAPSARKSGTLRERIVLGSSQSRGEPRSPSAAFDNLRDLCASLALGSDLLFDIRQEDDDLLFEVTESADLSAELRLDIANDQLQSVKYGSGAPSVTDVIRAGAGDGLARAMAAARDTVAAGAWGRRIEQFMNAGGTADPNELTQQALNDLATGGAYSGFTAVPTDDLQDVAPAALLGAYVTVVVNDLEVVARVNQVALVVGENGVSIGVTLGDEDGTDWEQQTLRTIASLATRVSQLERNAGQVPDRLSVKGQQVADWNDAVDVGFYWSDSGAANAPINNALVGKVYVHEGIDRIVQEIVRPSANAADQHATYRRVWNGSSWSAWTQLPIAPHAEAAGVVTVTSMTNGATRTATVTFPAGRFSVAPIVKVTPNTGAPDNVYASASGVSASGMTVAGHRKDSTTTLAVWWHAIQMTPSAAAG